jgi:hypothetical protein
LSSIAVLKYQTYMNMLAILPDYAKYGLQRQNIKENVIKPHSTLSD